MEEESFIGAFGDVPTDLAGDYSQLYIFRAEDFGAWYRRVRDAHEREVDTLRDETYVDTMTDTELAERGLVRLPVDADGVTWTGAEHEYSCQRFDGTWKNKPLVALAYDAKKGKWTCLESYSGNDAASCHHDEPTVEDVLREFTDEVWNRCCEGATASDSGIDELVAECAAKLRELDAIRRTVGAEAD